MKYIKTFESAFSDPDIMQYGSDDIKPMLKDIFDKMSEGSTYMVSYSAMVSNDYDLEENWSTMQTLIESKGISLDELTTHINTNLSLNNQLRDWCGYADLLMYKLYDDTGYLYGMSITEWMESDAEYEEDANTTIKLKYTYGWHQNTYGQLVLERDLGSVEKFLELHNEAINPTPENNNIKHEINGILIDIDIECTSVELKRFLDKEHLFNIIREYKPSLHISHIEGDIKRANEYVLYVHYAGDEYFTITSDFTIKYENLDIVMPETVKYNIDVDLPVTSMLQILFKQLYKMYGEKEQF